MVQRCSDRTALGARLLAARRAVGMSQTRLAAAAGVTSPVIAQIETGRTRNPKSETLAGIARALGVTVEYLLFGNGDEHAA